MPFKEGEPRPEGAGRKAGVPNKTTASMKAAWEEAFIELGGKDALVQWGRREPGEFFKSIIKLCPKDIKVSGSDGGPIQFVIVTGVPKDSGKSEEKPDADSGS